MKYSTVIRVTSKTKRRLPATAKALLVAWAAIIPATAGDPESPNPPSLQIPPIPLSEPPQNLKDEDGNHELDLVDPFQRNTARPVEEEEQGVLSATSLGEISEEFKILAIIIPEDGTREPMALIRLRDEANPQVVKKDDLVQIRRRPEDRRPKPQVRTGASDETSFEQSALNALETFSFYLQIREIHPTHIEAFQKKSPNESIILR